MAPPLHGHRRRGRRGCAPLASLAIALPLLLLPATCFCGAAQAAARLAWSSLHTETVIRRANEGATGARLAGARLHFRRRPRPFHGLRAASDPWQVLGVERGASPAEIKRAYRKKALKEHPDVNKSPDAKERWQELSQAYDILSDPDKARTWQAAGRGGGGASGKSPQGGQSRRPAGPPPTGPRQQAVDAAYDVGGDSFGAIFGDFLEGLGEEVGGGGVSVSGARKAGAFVLEELLDYLEGGKGPARGMGRDYGSRPDEELRMAREEMATLRQLEATLRTEAETFESQASAAKALGNGAAELESMQRVFDARERRSNVRRRVVRAEERVEYLEKVVFETERKRGGSAKGPAGSDSPGTYTIVHNGTKVGTSAELTGSAISELSSGASVRVLEVVRLEMDKRVRARLEVPAGWISLVNTETGFRWATKAPSAAGAPPPPPPRVPEFDPDAALAELKRQKSRG